VVKLQKAISGQSNRQDRVRRNSGVRRHRIAASVTVDLGLHGIMKVTTAPQQFLQPGCVVRVHFPFAECDNSKVRPAIVLSKAGQRVSLVEVTSSPRAFARTDIEVLDLLKAGLHKPSKARTGRIVTVDRYAVIEVLGRLSHRDAARILPSPVMRRLLSL
jgi:hypothetical protein